MGASSCGAQSKDVATIEYRLECGDAQTQSEEIKNYAPLPRCVMPDPNFHELLVGSREH